MGNGPTSSPGIKAIQAQIIGKDSSAAAFKSATSNLKKLTSATTGARAKLRDFTIIGRGVVGLLQALGQATSTSSKTAVEHELALKRLDFALARVRGVTKNTRQQFIDQADAIQRSTRVSGLMVTEMQHVLLTMGKLSTDQVPSVVNALIDYVEAYRGGNGLIEITRQAARAIGGAGGDVGELGAVLDKFGVPAERAASLVAQLTQKFGGAAKAIGETASGSFQRFQNRLKTASGAIGQAILRSREMRTVVDVVTKVMDRFGLGLTDLKPQLDLVQSVVDRVITGIRKFAFAFLDFALKVVPAVLLALDALSRGISEIAYALGQAFQGVQIPGLARFSAGVQAAGKSLSEMGEALGGVIGHDVAAAFKGQWEEVRREETAFQKLANAIDESRSNLTALALTGKFFGDLTTAELGKVALSNKSLNELWQELVDKVGDFKEAIVPAGKEISQGLDDIRPPIRLARFEVEALSGAISTSLADAFDPDIGKNEAFKQLAKNIKGIFIEEFANLAIGPLFSFDQSVVREGLGEQVETVLGPLGTLAEVVSSPFKGIGDAFADATIKAQAFGAAGQTVGQQLQEAFKPLGILLGSIFSIPLKILGKVLDATIGTLGRIFTTALTEIGIISATDKAAKTEAEAAHLAALSVVVKATAAAAASLAAAWAPAATAAAIATLGGALAFGSATPATLAASTAAISAAASAIATTASASTPGARVGGYTVGEGLVNVHPNEIIVPLSDPRASSALGTASGSAGATIEINLNNATISSPEDATQMADLIAERLTDLLRLNEGVGGAGIY